jgi:septal ring factor EnvC (AmiA/AmiB activator)
MALTRQLVCAHCGRAFKAPMKPGPPPKYCSPAHRQRAHEQRHRADDAEALRRANEQIQALQARIQWLERDNRLLREELADTAAEYRRLHRKLNPLPPGSVDFSQPGIHVVGLEPEPEQPPKRGRRRSRDT